MNNYQAKGGIKFTIRQPIESDAEGIIHFAKVLFPSTDQVVTTPEEFTMTVEQEQAWIRSSAQNPDSIILIAEADNVIVGLLSLAAHAKKKFAHTGEFGVSVHPNYQGMGIGRKLVETLLEWAKGNAHIEKVFLNVFHTNQKAIELYRSLGFIEEGRHIKAAKQPSGEYVDVIQMYVETK